MKGLFIAGTDTDAGKTVVSCALLVKFAQQGRPVQGMKPVASGCNRTPHGLRNEDAEMLSRYSSEALPYSTVNPYAFEPAIAPHLAAEMAGTDIELDVIEDAYHKCTRSGLVIVEGVGGWQVPLNQSETTADMAIRLQLPVVLVVGLRLGCINHALLTYESVKHSGLVCAGWVANKISPEMACVDHNIEAIDERLDAPLLGVIPCLKDIKAGQASGYLRLDLLAGQQDMGP